MASIKVSVIVVTYNGVEWVDKCFGSLEESHYPVDVIVIDNDSKDETVSLIKNRFPSVTVIESGQNLGFGKANNIGIKRALAEKADYVFLLNQDAWVQPDTIGKLVDVAENNREFGLISPLHLNGAGDALEVKFSEYVNSTDCPSFISDMALNKLKEIYDIHFVNAASWLLSRRCIEKVGGFDPLFPHYGEDEDYVDRIKMKGFRIGVTPVTAICHVCSFKGWDAIKWNPDRLLVINFIMLKRISSSYRTNWVNYIKAEFDKQTSLLLFRRFRELFFRMKLSARTLKYYSRVKKARKLSRPDFAFLHETER